MFNLTCVSHKPICSTYQESYDKKLLQAKAIQFVDGNLKCVAIISDENGIVIQTLKGQEFGYSVENTLEKNSFTFEQNLVA